MARRSAWTILATALACATPVAAGEAVLVRAVGAKVEVSATGVPLNEVLDAVARTTGTALTYAGGTPRRLITVSIESAAPVEVFRRVLEGTGVGFILRTDPAGQGVVALHVIDSGTNPQPEPPSTVASAAAPDDPPPAVEPPGEGWPGAGDPLVEPPAGVGGDEAPGDGPEAIPPPPGLATRAVEPESPGGPGSSFAAGAPLTPPAPGPATAAQEGSWPPGMSPVEPADSGGSSSGAAQLPSPPVAVPATGAASSAPPPGMRLGGAAPSTPPPEPQ